MRIGNNPEKLNKTLTIDSYHRVIIPVYIPNLEEDYFKDGLKILKLCLETLLQTIHSKTRISLINNNSCKVVSDYLQTLYNSNSNIDQLLLSKNNVGKVNAIYSAIKSNLEPLITISDADVMFLSRWQEEVEKVLNSFPEAGMVSPVPSSKAYSSKFINSTIFYALTKGNLAFTDVLQPEAMINFQESIGRTDMYNKQHLSKYLTINNNSCKAVIGCGHFVATLRAEVFKFSPNEVCRYKIVGGSESNYFDIPNDKARLLRLATLGNYAYHLGNKEEQWMKNEYAKITSSKIVANPLYTLSNSKPIPPLGYLIGKLLHRILFKKGKKLYFYLKGMKGDY